MPLGPPDFEAKVSKERMASPGLSRGQGVYDVLFLDVGSLAHTISDDWKAKRSRQPAGESSRQGGLKEADALVLCQWDTNNGILALEVAYQNESLTETAEEVLMWGKQPDLLAIGLKIDSRSTSHKLDPKATLFISRKPGLGEATAANGDGLASIQYLVGRGSGISVDRHNGPNMDKHLELEQDPEHGHLLAEIDWEGSAAQMPKQWYSPADGYDLIQGESMVSLPLGHQLEVAVAALLCGTSAVTSSAALESTAIDFSTFMATFSIAIDLSRIRRIILKATLDKWMQVNSARSTLDKERYLAGLQARKTAYKTERAAERQAEENSERVDDVGKAGPSSSKSRKLSTEEPVPAAEEGDHAHGPETPETYTASSTILGGLGRRSAKNARRKARRVKQANKKVEPLQPANLE